MDFNNGNEPISSAKFEKHNNIYRYLMLIIVTALITFLITAIGMYNYYVKTEDGLAKTLMTTETNELESKIKLIRKYLDESYLGEINNEEELIESAIKGYVAGIGDEYTEYLTKEEYEELMIDVNGDYVGIGIYMSEDIYGNVVILLPIEGSPAEEADLRTGDIITKVNGEACTDMELSIVANNVKGEEGTTVDLEISRDGEILNKTVERRTVEINPISAEVLEGNIGYIEILSFDDECSIEFEEKLNELLKKNIKSLIIDVRDNGGGIVTEAIDISELFISKGNTIMIELDKSSKEYKTIAKTDAKIDSNIEIVILANENSASASEIFVGALKDNEVAKIVGNKTFGKGVMQEIVPVASGGALKLTIEEFRTPNGEIINKKGIEPDIEIQDDKKTEADEQLQKAIEILK
ncbi:MAG: S41 family peptidase [Clostridia bacterium]|nr:S41 family peptidase [Clostridia bacterium]